MMTPARAKAIAEYVMLDSVEQEVRAALLDFAAMVERCEELHSGVYGISDDDYNYILKGATNERK